MDDHPLYRVISILELLQPIYSLLDKKDHINLMSVSRRAFTYAAPMLWEDVDLQHLLLLILGATARAHYIDTTNPFGPGVLYRTFDFPITLDLSRRFKLYSSSVRILRSATPYSVNFPDDFPSPDSQPSTALLPPNLERLLVHTHFHTRPYLSWVRRFLVPSLREFRLLPIRVFEEDIEGLELRPESYLELANKVIASSPRIEVLDIYAWEPNALCKSEDHPSPYRYCKHQQLYTRSFKDLWERLILLGQMQTLTTYGLRSLSISIPYICSEFLQSLGALPYLETLQLHIDRNKIQIADKIPIVLSDNSFANLGHLGLYGFHPSMFEQLSSPRAFFRNLTTAVIHIYKLERSDLFNNSEPLSRDVAPVLGQNSPYLIRLAVKHLVTDRSTALRLPLLDAYSHTSLRYLELDTIQMAFRGSSQNTQRAFEWGQLLTVMPHLEELKLRDQEISLQELCAITTMLLRLRLLLLKAVLLNEGLVMPDLVGKPAVVEPITVHCWFQRGQRGWGSGLALGLAKCIHLFRPNARFEAHENTGFGDQGKVWFTKEVDSAMVYVRLGLELPPMRIPDEYRPLRTDMIKAYNRTPLTCYLRLRERMARDNQRM